MAKGTARNDGPDIGDIDGQGAIIGVTASENGGGIDPASIVGTSADGSGNDSGGNDYARDASGNIKRNRDGSPQRKRGRKAGVGNGTPRNPASKAANNENLATAIDTLAMTLGGIHIALAYGTKTPELKLDESESQALAKSIAKVMEQFEMTPDPRFVAVGGLIATSATIYGPRMYLISERKKEAKKDASVTEQPLVSPNVVPIDPSNYDFTGRIN